MHPNLPLLPDHCDRRLRSELRHSAAAVDRRTLAFRSLLMLGPDRRTRMPLLLLLLAACAQLVAAAPSFPPRASSGPYRFTSAAAHWINVRGESQRRGQQNDG